MKKIKLILLSLSLISAGAMAMKKTNIVKKTNESKIEFHEEAIDEENPAIVITRQAGEHNLMIMYFLKEKNGGN